VSGVQLIYIKFTKLTYKSEESMLARICPWRMSTETESGNLVHWNTQQSKSFFEDDMTQRNIHKKNQLAMTL